MSMFSVSGGLMPPVVVIVARPLNVHGATEAGVGHGGRAPGVMMKLNAAGVLLTVVGLPGATASQLGLAVSVGVGPMTTVTVATAAFSPSVPVTVIVAVGLVPGVPGNVGSATLM